MISSNHYLADLLGLLVVGSIFPGDASAQAWRRFAAEEFPKALLSQTHDDGGLDEASLRYHAFVTEMALLFRDHLTDDVIEEAIATTLEVADKIETYDIFRDPQSPAYQVPEGYTPETYMEEITWLGLLDRLGVKSRAEINAEYKERLEYELNMLEQMGYSTYFLVVWDYIKYARDNGIAVGPGRGSAAGSLVAYALAITNIDPVHHGLLFERFLNPERKSMPDIDTDFCIDQREKIIEYVTQKYGDDHVAQIITFNRLIRNMNKLTVW